MADYRLTQSGDEVQELLNQVTPNQQAIQGLQNDKVDKVEGKGLSDENFTANEKNKLGDLPTESELNTELGKKATIVSLGEETQAREQADQTLQGNIDTEEARAKAAEKQNSDDIDAIEAKIPVAASDQNQLADKQFVNQTVATATATFRGTYNLVNDLHLEVGATRAAIIDALAATISGADNNDYCFVQIPTATATPTEIAAIDRYKFNGSAWAYEYTLNNSGFTAAQWDAINSGITSGLVAKLAALPTNSELTTLLLGKQDVINDLSAIRSGAASGATAYQKPVGGIPGSDMSSAVQGSLAKAEAAAPQSTTYNKTEVDGLVGDEETRAKAAEKANADDIDAIEAKIPTGASASNKLATEQFVNSSVATNSATFKGSFNEVNDLQLTPSATRSEIATALAGTISGADNNDYAFVQIPTATATPTEIARVERYKFNGTVWSFEYELNNSGFTADQWEAINSTITSGLVAKLSALPTNADLTTLLAGKQDVISDLSTIRSGAAAGATAYQLPVSGMPKSDLTSGVQTSLDKADAAAPQATTYNKTEVDGLIGDEETRAKAAEKANADDIDAIEEKIPAAASSSNQLADKAFVNSSINTATAQFKGTFNLVSDLSLTIAATHTQVGTALAGAISGADNNDYAFVQVPAADATPTVIASVDRYKFNGTDWTYEFTLNNSGFTAAQWDALNSGITSGLVTKLTNLPTESELTALLNGKQAVIADLSDIRSGAAAGATAYQKPVGGIPDTDLTAALQAQIASFITKAVSDLTNYYLKSDTYSKNEVDQLVAAINQFELVSVQTLPTASASTMGKLYFVPSSDPQTSNIKDEYITLSVTENDTTTYYWEQIGSTEINLTNYYTKTQTDAAITAALNTALASYSTTTQVGIIVSTAITTALTSYYNKTEIDAQMAQKQSVLTFDNTPTENSDNPVKSGGVYDLNQSLYNTLHGEVQTVNARIDTLFNADYVGFSVRLSDTTKVMNMIGTAEQLAAFDDWVDNSPKPCEVKKDGTDFAYLTNTAGVASSTSWLTRADGTPSKYSTQDKNYLQMVELENVNISIETTGTQLRVMFNFSPVCPEGFHRMFAEPTKLMSRYDLTFNSDGSTLDCCNGTSQPSGTFSFDNIHSMLDASGLDLLNWTAWEIACLGWIQAMRFRTLDVPSSARGKGLQSGSEAATRGWVNGTTDSLTTPHGGVDQNGNGGYRFMYMENCTDGKQWLMGFGWHGNNGKGYFTRDDYKANAQALIPILECEAEHDYPTSLSGTYAKNVSELGIATDGGGSASSGFFDGNWSNTSDDRIFYAGGSSDAGAVCGPFARFVGHAAANANWDRRGRVALRKSEVSS